MKNLALLVVLSALPTQTTARAPASNPARVLDCTLGRALNLDPSREQTAAEIRYEGKHRFSLFLPSSPVRDAQRPGSEIVFTPVNPATRVIADPAGLRRGVPTGFGQVVDLWPNRVEMMQTIKAPLLHFIVISAIDTRRGTANLFMTTATDVASMNLKTVYQGPCKITLAPRKR